MKKLLSKMSISFILSFLIFTTTAMAAFPDLQDKRWDWARSMIEEMSKQKIIMGFEDGSFRPADSVTKLQSLLLVARVLGVNEDINKDYAELAEEVYRDIIEPYGTDYTRDIAYLLYKGALSTQELSTYLSPANAGSPLKRYEAAMLLAKAMGKEDEVKSKVIFELTYKDADSIPAIAKPYVECVSHYGIMQGMTETEFVPMYDVNRAQMSVMLYRVLERNKTIITHEEGELYSVEPSNRRIIIRDRANAIKEYTLDSTVKITLDGRSAVLDELPQNCNVLLTWNLDDLYMIECISPQMNQTVEGVITSAVSYGDTSKQLRIDIDGVIKEYTVDHTVQVIYNGEISEFHAIKRQDYAKLEIENGKVKRIEAEGPNKEVSGIIRNIILQPNFKLEIQTADRRVETYEVDNKVSVRKNNKIAELRDIEVGDEVRLELRYNKIESIVANSERGSAEGIVEEIIISSSPSIKIKVGDELRSYNLKRDAVIKVDGEEVQIYDLRLGYNVKLTLDGNTIVQLETKAISQTQQITGTVELVNSSYGFINVNVVDGISGEVKLHQVFIKKNARIIDSITTKNLRLDDIKIGDTVTAVGNIAMGVFEANTIIVISGN